MNEENPRLSNRCHRTRSYDLTKPEANAGGAPNRLTSFPSRAKAPPQKVDNSKHGTHRSQQSQPTPRNSRRLSRSPSIASAKKKTDEASSVKSSKSITRDRSIVSAFPNSDILIMPSGEATDLPRTMDFFPKEGDIDSPEAILFNMNGSKFDSLDLETAELEDPSIESENTEEKVDTHGEVPADPRLIVGSPGSRIRVALGGTGRNFLILIDEDDGKRSWQSKSWAGLPLSLENKLREVGYVHQCSFAGNGEDWFLTGKSTTTGKMQSWWSVKSPKFHESLQTAVDGGMEVRVVFGEMERDQYIILLGANGYTLGSSLPNELLFVLDNIYRAETSIARVRGLNSRGNYLVEEAVDDDADDVSSTATGIVRSVYHAQGLSPHLQAALETYVENQEDLHEIAMGTTDPSWLVIRDNSWDGSIGIHDKLATLLDQFYDRHIERQLKAEEDVSLFIQQKRLREQQMSLLAAEKRLGDDKTPSRSSMKKMSSVSESQRQLRRKEAVNSRQDRIERQRRKVFEMNEISRKRLEKEDRLTELAWKGLQPGQRVTVLGVSTKFDDITIDGVEEPSGIIRIRLPPAAIKRKRRKSGCSTTSGGSSFTSNQETVIPIHDARRLVKLSSGPAFDDSLESAKLVEASDKYEAALIQYHGYCEQGKCACKRDFSGFSQKVLNSAKWSLGERVHVIGYADGTVIESNRTSTDLIHVMYDDHTSYHVSPNQLRLVTPMVPTGRCRFLQRQTTFDEVALRIRPEFELFCQPNDMKLPPFDNFLCSEKIDVRRLQKLAADLRSDSLDRRSLLDDFFARVEENTGNSNYDVCYHILEKCLDLEETVYSLFDILKGNSLDEDGCLVHKVQYHHRDAACRGRLYAVGHPVRLLESKFPRTLTLQGVQHDLLPTLCGAFCHYVDCENSDIHLLCSLASQLGLATIIPTIIDYKKHRNKWIAAIAQEHPDTTDDEVKRLVNVILYGGSYEHWFKQVDAQPVSKVRRFAYRLEVEAKAIRDQLLHHPRFQWTQIEKTDLNLQSSGHQNDETIKSILFQRILQSCESDVSEIVHRTFHNRGWRVRAKIFDSLIVERGPKATHEAVPMIEMFRIAEKTCEASGWEVKLAEKPLRGLENQPIVAVHEARSVLSAVKNAHELQDMDDILDEVSRTSVATDVSRTSAATEASSHLQQGL